MEKFAEKIKSCLQNEPAFCTATCPFHLDVRDFIAKIRRGGFNAAYRTYLNAVAFPGIVSELCDEPCKEVCPRRLKDQAVALRLLEKAAVRYARNVQPNRYNLPPKNKKIAIIGAGISGLGCALRLASKKYAITVFEKSGRIGGHLWDLLPPEVFLADIERQFAYEQYTLHLHTEITSLEELDFDAVYVATGASGTYFGGAAIAGKPGVFWGGELCGKNPVEAIADGLAAAGAIERYLKTGGMRGPEEEQATKIELNADLITPLPPVWPSQGETFTREEAVAEANRCLQCTCDACIRHCDLMRYYGKYPKRIGEEVHITVYPGTLDGDGTVATRLISTCNHCGLCKTVCPLQIDTGDFLLQSHRAMRRKGSMPWAFHDFWLRDMEFAGSEAAGLCRLPPGYSRSRYLFFSGCQLGASDPAYVIAGYRFLLDRYPDTALYLGCCGAPAEWAGDEPLHAASLAALRQNWVDLGKPAFVFACPTCKQMFQKYLPEIKGVFLYTMLLKGDFPDSREAAGETVSVFDPCASREEPELQQDIRTLARQAGLILKPLSGEGKLARCCSWGGQVSIANPSFAREVVKVRIAENSHPYLTYCINCRDIFAAAHKPVYHILDILFGLHSSGRPPPTITERRSNRKRLKRLVLGEFWKEEVRMEQGKSKLKLRILPELKAKLNSEMILETDIEAVIAHCESSGQKVFNPQNGHFTGHLQIGRITYWAEYRPAGKGFELVNAYSHRMKIEGS